MYAKDKAAYGDPAESSFKVSEVRELDNWQIVLHSVVLAWLGLEATGFGLA